MDTLTYHDLQFSLRRTPRELLEMMRKKEWSGKIFVGGGFIRACVAGEPINDVDVFVSTKEDAEKLALQLVAARLKVDLANPKPGYAEKDEAKIKKHIHRTDNALTLFGFRTTIQIIHRWVFETGFDVADSFDFTNCCACFWWKGESWCSYCDERFYPDVAARRLVYRYPVRNEDAGGSMLRVLKYYQKGYRMPLDSLAGVIARLAKGCKQSWLLEDEKALAKAITGLLREVDPLVDPSHIAHLPTEDGEPVRADIASVPSEY